MGYSEIACGDNYIHSFVPDTKIIKVAFQINKLDYELYLAYIEEDPTVEIEESGRGWYHITGNVGEVEKYLMQIMNVAVRVSSFDLFGDGRPSRMF